MKPLLLHRFRKAWLLIALGVISFRADGSPIPNRILAVVNQDVITYQDVELDPENQTERMACEQKYQGQELLSRNGEIRLETLHRLIENRLIVQEFRREGYNFPDAQVDDMVADAIKIHYGGKESALLPDLAKRNETLEDYRTSVEEWSIIKYMTTQNVDQKVVSTVQGDVRKQREAIRQAWLYSLGNEAYIEILP